MFNDDSKREMHSALCADCGNPTQVPFVPTRPVYCRDCYPRHKTVRTERTENTGNRGNYDRGSRGNFSVVIDRRDERREITNGNDNKFNGERTKPITQDMIERASFNNMTVDQLGFYDSQSRYISVSGKQLNIFTLTPSAPTIMCQYIGFGMTITDPNNPATKMMVRMCSKDAPKVSVCRKTDTCPADLRQLGENGFWVISNGTIEIDEVKMPFKIGFFDKIHRTYDSATAFSKNPDEEKAMSLLRHYNGIKSGVVSPKSRPKPGNEIFRTLFSHENEVSVRVFIKSQKLRTGEQIIGTVKGYEETTRGMPALKVWTENKDNKVIQLRMVDISQIDFMLVDSYKAPMWRKISIELLTRGHLVLPHPEKGGGMSIDVCDASKGGSDILIHTNGDLSRRNDGDKHNGEMLDLIKEIRKEYETISNNEKKLEPEEE
jgi:CxxC-x17-CxxC domain-containing protein